MVELMGALPAWVWGIVVVSAFVLLLGVVVTGARLRIRHSATAGVEIDTRLQGIAALLRSRRRAGS